jgi:hypothetical protein
VAQSSEQAPFTSGVVGSILTTDSCMTFMWKESVNALPRVVGSPGTLVSSRRECWQGGLGLSPYNWPFHRSCTPWSDMSHKVAAMGALRKPSTRSGWAASFVIQLSSQRQVRMISKPHLLTDLATPRVFIHVSLVFSQHSPRALSQHKCTRLIFYFLQDYEKIYILYNAIYVT